MLTPDDRRRLVSILGMLGSEHTGERDAAAIAAVALMKRCAATWDEVIQPAVNATHSAGFEQQRAHDPQHSAGYPHWSDWKPVSAEELLRAAQAFYAARKREAAEREGLYAAWRDEHDRTMQEMAKDIERARQADEERAKRRRRKS